MLAANTAASPVTLGGRLRREAGVLVVGCLCLAATNALGLGLVPRVLQHAIDTLKETAAGAHRAVAFDALLIAGAA